MHVICYQRTEIRVEPRISFSHFQSVFRCFLGEALGTGEDEQSISVEYFIRNEACGIKSIFNE
jgi:hypothetical protein